MGLCLLEKCCRQSPAVKALIGIFIIVLVLAICGRPYLAGLLLAAATGTIAGGLAGALASHPMGAETGAGTRETFTLPGAAPPIPVIVSPIGAEVGSSYPSDANESTEATPGRYPGDFEYERHQSGIPAPGIEQDSSDEFGHPDRMQDGPKDEGVNVTGNPYDASRTDAPRAQPPCIDDEANDDEIDGDERMVYNNFSRNDATRVTAGTMNRRRTLDPYLREEVEEAEDREWFGRHEI